MKIKLIMFSIILLAGMLRFYRLDIVPQGLYSDEVSIAYNAKTILLTGKDEWGQNLPIIFKAYGEYKLPVYIYLTALFEALVGFNDIAVRLPSVIAGIVSVALVFLIVNKLFNKKLGLLAAFLMAISPWAIQFSRGGFEGNLALVFLLGALYLFEKHVFLAFIFMLLATQTYLSARGFAPIFFLILYIIYRPRISFKTGVILGMILIFLLPTYFSYTGTFRLQDQSILTSQGNILLKLVTNFVNNFSFDFLFFHGDPNPRHSLLVLGELYLWQLPIVIIGVTFLLKKINKSSIIIFAWLFIGSLPVTLSNISPHALRGLLMVFPWQVLTALGLWKFNKVFIVPVVMVFMVFYLHTYYVHIPSELGQYWGGGIPQVLDYAAKSSVSKVYVQEKMLAPYYHWYTNNPEKFVYVQGSRSLTDLEKGNLLISPSEIKLPFKKVFSDQWWEVYEL